MICIRGGYIIQRHNEIRDLEAEILRAVCTDVEMEPVLQDVTGEVLPRGANKAPDARLDIRAQGFIFSLHIAYNLFFIELFD